MMKSIEPSYNIVCLKWGTKYPADFVNRLYRMVKRNTSLPIQFYCISDDPKDLDSGINFRQIEDIGLKGWWYKLMLFKSELYDIKGTTIFLDLDVVITENIDELFTYNPGEFQIIKDLKSGFNSSVFRLEIGTLPEVWNNFWEEKESIIERLHGDQDWIAEAIPQHMNTWPSKWVVSYKKQCNSRAKRSYGRLGEYLRKIGLMKPPSGYAVIPEYAKIVIFHGKPDPVDVMNGPWDMWKEAPWIREYWN